MREIPILLKMSQNNSTAQTLSSNMKDENKNENEKTQYDSEDERENDDESVDSEAVPEVDDSDEEGIYEYCEITKGVWHRRLREENEDPDELHRRIKNAETAEKRAQAFWN
jgi:hypothetical protein